MRRLLVLFVAGTAVVAAVAVSIGALPFGDQGSSGVRVPAGGPLPLAVEPDPDERPEMDLTAPPVALAPPGGAIVQGGLVRLLKPKVDLTEPRRVGIQIGHYQTTDIPKEYGTRLPDQTGASFAGHDEVDVNQDIAERIGKLLTAQGVKVDILPTTVPPGYVADVFIALHCDSDGVGDISGFKMAHNSRRGPYEEKLLQTIKTRYAAETGLDYDSDHISRAMVQYYAANWSRYQHATSAFTPSVILEMGFISNRADRNLLVNQPDRIATAIANGILNFLDTTPRSKIFGEDLLIPQTPIRQGQAATPSPSSR